MAHVRVYCGLASADPAERPAVAGASLTSAVVDDAGRLLHVCEISDDPAGYGQLGALLAERSSGLSGAAIAADSDDHTVVSLLSAGGRPLAIADDDSVDDFAERFADDESLEEMQSPPAERRAVGLARALQAGALSATTLPVPRDLAGYKPVLSAHAALANGRHSAAVALREVLRELYPAALRAYPDPAEPVSLAVLDALPEPGMIGGAGGRARDTSVATDAIAAHLVADGVADTDTITEAVTALRVAIAETPRRPGMDKALTSTVAETVRQAVAAVRACDSGCEALVAALAARVVAPTPTADRRAVRQGPGTQPAAVPSGSPAGDRRPEHEPVPAVGRRRQPSPEPGNVTPVRPQPMAPPPAAPAPVAPPPRAPRPIAPAASAAPPPNRAPSAVPVSSAPPAYRTDSPANRPVSAPPPPPPGITPIAPTQRRTVPPAEAGEPFRATLTTAAINSARAERQRPTPIVPRPKIRHEEPAPTSESMSPTGMSPTGMSPTDFRLPMPAARPAPAAPPGSRANWPLVNPSENLGGDRSDDQDRYPQANRPPAGPDRPAEFNTGELRVTPPWLADDLPQEPPMLRLVEPPPLADRALREGTQGLPTLDTPPLRLVEPNGPDRQISLPAARPAPVERAGPPPVADEGDGDLLIFAAARSAWFTGSPEESDVDWSSTADTGWRAAEQASQPAVGDKTTAGLPKRVPQANLVPGSPLREERPLRIVRNAASLAENTTGYFRGWRRGQEIGGYAVGGRPGREAAGGWDFSRDQDDRDDRDFAYRSAGFRS